MSQETYDELADAGQHAEPGELVHWMAPRPLKIGPAGISATAVSAFLLGMGVGAGALAIAHWMGRDQED